MLDLMLIEALAACGHDLPGHRGRPRRRHAATSWSPTCCGFWRPNRAAYAVGAVSWIFAERTGFRAYGRYMLRFARDNREKTKLLGDTARPRAGRAVPDRRDVPRPSFACCTRSSGDLRILLALILNAIVLGTQIDGSLPAAYAVGVRGAVCDAVVDAASAWRASIWTTSAATNRVDGAGLHRLGQRLHRQPLQPATSGSTASRPSCAGCLDAQIKAIVDHGRA